MSFETNIDFTPKKYYKDQTSKSISNMEMIEKENKEIVDKILKNPVRSGNKVYSDEDWKNKSVSEKMKIVNHFKIENKKKQTREKLRSKRKSKRK